MPAILFVVLSYYVYGLWMRSMKAKKKTADHDKEGEGEEAKEKGGDGVMESVCHDIQFHHCPSIIHLFHYLILYLIAALSHSIFFC